MGQNGTRGSLCVFEVRGAPDGVLQELVLRERLLVEPNLRVVMLLAQEALEVPVHQLGVLHRLHTNREQRESRERDTFLCSPVT